MPTSSISDKSPNGDNMKKLEIEAKTENLDAVTEFIDGELETTGCDFDKQLQIELAVEEVFVNISHYAYSPEVGKAEIGVEILSEPERARIRIVFSDSGIPYDPLAKDDPDVTLAAEDREIGGLGIFMIKKSMDNVTYEYADGRNILTLEKNL